MEQYLFYLLSVLILTAAVAAVSAKDPIHSVLGLIGAMVVLALLFFLLGANFLGAVQLIVYTGAVMVLFIMVVMLFDFKSKERRYESSLVRLVKVLSVCWFAGFLVGIVWISQHSFHVVKKGAAAVPVELEMTVKGLAHSLFTKYILAFEIVGLFLLVVTVGVIAVAQSKGGTHEC